MKHCEYCGEENPDNAEYCSNCGNRFDNVVYSSVDDSPIGCLLFIIILIWPIVGLILYLVWMNSYPKRAQSVLTPMIIGFVLNLIFVGSLFG
ncbi:MAG: zinc-ribbon domain-containing protein [Bacillota bacterium]